MPRKTTKFPPVIIISGLSGAGKSTLVRNLTKVLKYKQLDGGLLSRQMARDLQMTFEAFTAYRSKHPQAIDLALDRRLIQTVKRARGIVVQSRFLPYSGALKGVAAVRLYLKASQKERIARLAHREGISKVAAAQQLRTVTVADRKRFKKLYGIDILDLSVYDLVIDTTRRSPRQTLAVVLNRLQTFWNHHGNP